MKPKKAEEKALLRESALVDGSSEIGTIPKRPTDDRRLREWEERGTVPSYAWMQTLDEVHVQVKVPEGWMLKDVRVHLEKDRFLLSWKDQPPQVDGRWCESIRVDESYWTWMDGMLSLFLTKLDRGKAWTRLLLDDDSIDPKEQQALKERLMLERFQKENPGFDFTDAEFVGHCPEPNTFMDGMKYDG